MGSHWNLFMYSISIALFSQLGCAFRIFLTDWLDNCDPNPATASWWYPCITSSGTSYNVTGNQGGAIFTSLPGNMIACFIMGLLVPSSVTGKSGNTPVAILPSGWRIQQYGALWKGITTGFLGSLSTFASWNLQLLQMITLSHRLVGNQFAIAVFAYILGTVMSLGMFVFGAHLADACHSSPLENENDVLNTPTSKQIAYTSEVEKGESSREEQEKHSWVLADAALILGWLAVSCGSLAGAFILPTRLLRSNATAVFLGPLGAWMRWFLSRYNGKFSGAEWLPFGTLLANVIAVVWDVSVLGVQFVLIAQGVIPAGTELMKHITTGAVTGIGGCLSTVSTFTQEVFCLLKVQHAKERLCGYAYIFYTLFISAVLGLAIYAGTYWAVNGDILTI